MEKYHKVDDEYIHLGISKRDDTTLNLYFVSIDESWTRYFAGTVYTMKRKFELKHGFDILVSDTNLYAEIENIDAPYLVLAVNTLLEITQTEV